MSAVIMRRSGHLSAHALSIAMLHRGSFTSPANQTVFSRIMTIFLHALSKRVDMILCSIRQIRQILREFEQRENELMSPTHQFANIATQQGAAQ